MEQREETDLKKIGRRKRARGKGAKEGEEKSREPFRLAIRNPGKASAVPLFLRLSFTLISEKKGLRSNRAVFVKGGGVGVHGRSVG